MAALSTRQAQLDDTDAIVTIHLASFPGFFLSVLGRRFLRLLYRQFMTTETGILFVAEQEGKICGFVGGVTQQVGFYATLLRQHKWRFAAASLGALLRKPSIGARLLRARKRPREAVESMAEACLMSIGVDPAIEGKGIGRKLVELFCDEVRNRGGRTVCLTTDTLNNDRVNRFYQGLDFTIAREFVTDEGRSMYEYIRKLD